jgi:cell division protein FtsL
MIASSLSPKIAWSKDADRQPREFPRLIVLLVVILALVNVSAMVLMAGSWVSLSTGMLDLKRSMQDLPTDIIS